MLIICTECPMGCNIEVNKTNDGYSVSGNGCKRGEKYSIDEATCPKRVLTTTVRGENGVMIPVKTSNAIPKSEIFDIMKKVNKYVAILPVVIGQVLIKDISDGVDLIATQSKK